MKLISTDGVFSMDGIIAQLDKIHELAAKYNAIVHFDDCHATGFLGPQGRGSYAHHGVKVDFVTGLWSHAMVSSGALPVFVVARRTRGWLSTAVLSR